MERAPSIVVPGGLNTDIILPGVERLLGAGELCRGSELRIAPGGKSRNVAQMIAQLTNPGTVAMLGRTAKDPHGFWEIPYRALQAAGVNVDHVKVLSAEEAKGKLPGIALIPVDRHGQNQIYLSASVNDDFSPADIDAAEGVFQGAGAVHGILALSLEMPMETAMRAIALAKRHALRVVLDPGGISPHPSAEQLEVYRALLRAGVDVFKPNEHEVKILTDIAVTNLQTAIQAGAVLRELGVGSVLITAGAAGAYLIGDGIERHLPIPEVTDVGDARDETGCGDQTMAALCARLHAGDDLERATEIGILAGTLQFHRSGVDPLTREELEKHLGAK